MDSFWVNLIVHLNLAYKINNKESIFFQVISLGVHWQCRAYTADNQKESLSNLEHQQPNYLVTGDDLKR